METDPYDLTSPANGLNGLNDGQLLWWILSLAALLLLVGAFSYFASLRIETIRSGAPHDNGEGSGKGNTIDAISRLRQSRLASLLAAFLASFSGFALSLYLPIVQLNLALPAWVVWSVIEALAIGLGALVLQSLAHGSARPDASVANRWWLQTGRILLIVLYPIIILLDRLLVHLSEVQRIRMVLDNESREEMDNDAGVLEEDEDQLGDFIASFRDKDVEEVMTSRMDISAIPTTATLQDAVDIIGESGHSRLPLYHDHLDHIEGIIYSKDLLPLLVKGNPDIRPNWRLIARESLLVSTDQSIEDLMRAFRLGTTHIAVVVDEFGGTEGVVTLEDVLEELVGEIKDEFDWDEPVLFEAIDDQHIRFDARVDLDLFKSVVASHLGANVDAAIDTEAFEFESLGGLVQQLTESIPDSGIEARAHGLVFRVEDVDQRRIGHVVVSLDLTRPDPVDKLDK